MGVSTNPNTPNRPLATRGPRWCRAELWTDHIGGMRPPQTAGMVRLDYEVTLLAAWYAPAGLRGWPWRAYYEVRHRVEQALGALYELGVLNVPSGTTQYVDRIYWLGVARSITLNPWTWVRRVRARVERHARCAQAFAVAEARGQAVRDYERRLREAVDERQRGYIQPTETAV